MGIIEIRNLSFTYPGAEERTLKTINLTVERGDFLAVVGNNGCGKSTLCKVLNGLIPHFIAGTVEGTVTVDGLDTFETDVGTLAKKAGYVYQDFENQIVRPTVLDDASYACLNYGMEEYRRLGREALDKCGLQGKEEEYVWQLSGGQTHLLALAGALALGPEILILDEPIAQLDPLHADRIYDILKKLNEEYDKTIIVIEHHTEYIAEYCKHVLLMKDGTACWKLPVKEALSRKEELEKSNIFPPQITRAAAILREKGLYRGPLPITVREGVEAFSELPRRQTEPKPEKKAEGNALLEFRNTELSYRSVKGAPKKVFDGLNLTIKKGEKIALIGSNGAGKSTLMKMIVGLLKPSAGEILLAGEDLTKKKAEELSNDISLVYQNPEEMFIQDTVEKDIGYAMKMRGVKEYEKKTDELLKRFRLKDLKDRDGRLLSGGQMRRASLAIGIALNPKFLLLDEPTANLDIATRKEITKVLDEMKEITETVMIATHDMQLVAEWADRILVLSGGTLVADGNRDEIFGNGRLKRRVGIRPPAIFEAGQLLDPSLYTYTVEEFVGCFKGVKRSVA